MQSLWQDARFAMRMLARHRSFTFVAVLSLALGVGINLSVFSFVNALFLRPVPGIAAGEGLVAIQYRTRATGAYTSASYPDFQYYRRHAQSFSGLAAYAGFSSTARAADATERVSIELVSDEYFQVLGARPAAGRLLDSRDAQPGAEPVVVLSHEYWQRTFGGDQTVVGRTVRVGSGLATVVGVAPRDFSGLLVQSEPPALWMPISAYRRAVPSLAAMNDLQTSWGAQTFHVAGRLKPDVDPRRAAVEIRTLAAQLDAEREAAGVKDLADYLRLEALLVPAEQARLAPVERGAFLDLVGMLTVIAILILSIACFNVATLTIARAGSREQEMAIRSAIGASWRRIVQQTVVENLALSFLATLTAVPVSLWTSRLLTGFGPASPLSVAAGAGIDARVIALAAGLTILTGLLLSLLPARVAARTTIAAALGRRSRGATTRPGVQSALVAAQVALSVVLLAGAGLFIRTLVNALAVDVTVRSDDVLLARIDPGTTEYDAERGTRLYADLLDRLRALPGVTDAAEVFVVPLGGRRGGTNIDWTSSGQPRTAQVGFNAVSTHHFPTIGMPIVAGRDFTDADRAGSPAVAIVNQVLAERMFAGRNPIGEHLTVKWRPASVVEIVGIVRDGKFRSYRAAMEPTVYVPLRQRYVTPITLEVRGADPRAIVPAIRREVAALDRNLAVTAVQTAKAHFDGALWRERLMATLVGGLGVLALLLVAIGLYGILSFSVAERTREIGVRMALGAQLASVVWLVLRRALAVVGSGAVLGAAASAVLVRYVRGLLYEVDASDPIVILSAAAALLGVMFAATFVPARRAASVDPVMALRGE